METRTRKKVKYYSGQEWVLFMMKCIMLFFFLFQIHFKGFPSWLGSEQISIIILSIILLLGNIRFKIKHTEVHLSIRKTLALIAFLFVYSIFALIKTKSYGIQGNSYLYTYCVFTAVIIFIGSYGFQYIFKDIEEFFEALRLVTLLQAVCIIIFLVFPSIQNIANVLFNTSEIYSKYTYGYHTGIGVAEAKGAMKMVPGLAACLYFSFIKKNSTKYILSYLCIMVSSTLLARTGFIFGIVGLFILILGLRKQTSKLLKIIVSSVIVGIICAVFIFVDKEQILHHFSRLSSLYFEFKNGGIFNITFFQKYFGIGSENVFPGLTKETIFGTGIISGISGNRLKFITDGGYLKLYAAVGFPITVISYLLILIYLVKPTKNIKDHYLKYTLYFLIIYIFLGEFKEVHIFFGYPICIAFTLELLYEKSVKC